MTKQIKKIFKGFTLVELIIVIAIIAILSVTAFMTITKWIGESRDSRRLSDIGSIHRALNYNYVDQSTSEKYPLPDEAQTVTGENGEILWKQGVFGSTATEEASTLTKTPEDPTGEKYEYSVTDDQETYEVYAKLENGEEISYLTDKAYAQPAKYIAKRGNYNGYIVGNTGSDYKLYNSPSIYLTTGAQLTSGTTNNIYQEGKKEDIQINITGTNISNLYDSNSIDKEKQTTLDTISKNYPEITNTTKAQKIVNSAGNNTESVTTSNNDGDIDNTSCKTILDTGGSTGDGIYEIDPDGDGSGFEVYCDMTTDGGGWIKLYTDFEAYSIQDEKCGGHDPDPCIYESSNLENYNDSSNSSVDVNYEDKSGNSYSLSNLKSIQSISNKTYSSNLKIYNRDCEHGQNCYLKFNYSNDINEEVGNTMSNGQSWVDETSYFKSLFSGGRLPISMHYRNADSQNDAMHIQFTDSYLMVK